MIPTGRDIHDFNNRGHRSRSAENLMDRLERVFIPRIKELRQKPFGLADVTRGATIPRKVRIAVIDTGVDPSDTIIHRAIKCKRIAEKRSWVGTQESWTDTHGHGTHVTRLLLQIAPSAEVYVAKITDGRHVHPEDMLNIAKVSPGPVPDSG